MLDDTSRAVTTADPFASVRQRARPSPTPSHWSNGSAVFQSGMSGRRSTWGQPTEEQDGFIGRIERQLDGSYKVWRWRSGNYIYAGAAKDHVGALAAVQT
jgi:hypothetical protein